MSEASSQAEIERFGRLYVASSQVSHAVVRSRSRQELLDEVALVLVETGKFAMTTISCLDPASGELIPVARSGDVHGYLDRIRVFAHDRPGGQGPSGIAFRSATPYICNDFLNDPQTLRWRDAARESGWRASAAFPIVIDGVPHGILSVYSLEPGAFGPDQVKLLDHVALDLAVGLDRLDSAERRRQAEVALAASERRLQLAMDAAEMGAFDFDLGAREIAWDWRTQHMFGFAPGAFDRTFDAFAGRLHPDDRDRVVRDTDAARESHSVFSHEFRVVWPDGSEHWLFGRGGFLYNESGQPYRMCGAVADITERKRVEAALLQSEERLRQAVRASNIGIFDHNHVTGALYWSPELRKICGWGPDDPASLPAHLERIYPGDRERTAACVQRAHDPAGDGVCDVEHRIVLPDGGIRWVSVRSQTFFDGEGAARRAVRTIGAARDITGQMQAEEEQKKLAALVAMSRDFIGIATLEGELVYVNHAGMAMVGLSSIQEACRKTIFDIFAEADRERVRSGLFATLLDRGYWYSEARLRHFNSGLSIDVEITGFQIRDDSGVPIYLAAFVRDIAERKRAAADKAKLEAQLFQSQKMESIGRLAGGVAHDFNNMLTVINGYSQMAMAELTPLEPLWNSLDEIRKAGERAAGLTRQLLAFSRKQMLQPQVLDLHRVVRDLQPMLERIMGEDVKVKVALDAPSGVVRADPHQLEQVIMNLTANARDAMPDGGRLLIETAGVELDAGYARMHPGVNAGRYIMLAVSDSGIGMDEATRQRIFEPFFTTKPAGHGTGLGLAMVQGIVMQSGGHITVYSEPGHGTTFRIYLPTLDEAPAEAEKPGRAVDVGGKETVLVVEDMAQVRHFAAMALRGYGYRVIHAESAEEALEIGEREPGPIHLLLTDVVMPGLQGQDLARRLRLLRPAIKVLLMSGYTDKAIAIDGAPQERAGFIAKPFSPLALAKQVRALLGPPDDSGA